MLHFNWSSCLNNEPKHRGGPIEINRQPEVEKSDYQIGLEQEEKGHDVDEAKSTPHADSVRYWSDFNRVYHAPLSLHPLTPPPESTDPGRAIVETWDEGKQRFIREDAVSVRFPAMHRKEYDSLDLSHMTSSPP